MQQNQRNCTRSSLLFVFLLAFAVLSARAADYGLQPGVKVPAFVLKDQEGNAQTLKSLSGPNGLLLLFNRSADWCPFCKSQLIDLETARGNFQAKGIHVASITYDSPEVLKAFAARRSIHFAMLSDPDSAIIKAFGLNRDATGVQAGIAIPNFFLIAPDGTIRQRYAETELLNRATASYFYETLFGSGTAASSVLPLTPHLKVTLAQSDVASAPGARIRLTAQLAPEDGSHLYAPGAEAFGYRPVRIVLEPSDLYQTSAPVYARPTVLEFPKLQEKVPVFESATAITQDLWAVRSAKTNAHFAEHPDLVIHGMLEYQVCTNTTCFAPEKEPVSWKLHVSPSDLDTTRVTENLQRK